MPAFIVRFMRVVPIVIFVILALVLLYLYLRRRWNSARATHTLITISMVIFAALSVIFALACVYAVLDGNMFFLEFMACFLGIGLIGLLITLICRWRFLKKNPSYRYKRQKAHVKSRIKNPFTRVK